MTVRQTISEAPQSWKHLAQHHVAALLAIAEQLGRIADELGRR